MEGLRHAEVHFLVVLKSCVDVLQTGRDLDVGWNGETKSHGFSRFYIRVLAYQHHLQIVKGSVLEGIKDKFSWGVAGMCSVLRLHVFVKLLISWSLQVVLQGFLPISQVRSEGFEAGKRILIAVEL